MAASSGASAPNEVRLGDFVRLGRYTLVVCVLCELMILCQLGNMLFMMFAGAVPEVTGCGDVDLSHLSTVEACHVIAKMKHNDTSCVPRLYTQFGSVNLEYNLICGDAKRVKQSTSVQMVGVMIGAVVFGQFSDTYGRKKAMTIALAGCTVFMIASGFVETFFLFTLIRFIVNIFNGGQIAVMMIFCVENVPKKDRLWINNIVSWAPNYILYSGMAYLCGEWRTLAKVSGLFTVPALLLCCFVSESAQWLAQCGRLDEAQSVIERICRIDGRICDTVLLKQVLSGERDKFEMQQKKAKKYTFIHLFYNSKFAMYSIAIALSYFMTSLVNYGLVFNMEKLSGSIYVNAVLIGCLRYAINLFMAFLEFKLPWLGRKTLHFGAWVEIISACLFICVVQAFHLEATLGFLTRWAVVSVVAVTAQLYLSNAITSGELFPTCVRNLAYSFGQFHARIGVVVAPQLFLLTDFWQPLPYLVMGVLGFVDMLFFHCVVPETKGQPLLDAFPSKHDRTNLVPTKEALLAEPEMQDP